MYNSVQRYAFYIKTRTFSTDFKHFFIKKWLYCFMSINEFVHAFDRWRSQSALQRLRSQAAKSNTSFQDIEEEIAENIKDSFRKFIVFQVAYLRNMEYDIKL